MNKIFLKFLLVIMRPLTQIHLDLYFLIQIVITFGSPTEVSMIFSKLVYLINNLGWLPHFSGVVNFPVPRETITHGDFTNPFNK